MEGIDRLKDFDVLSVLYSLLEHYAAGEGVWLDTNDQSSISPGKYILSHQCYVIGTRTLFSRYDWSCDYHVTIISALVQVFLGT